MWKEGMASKAHVALSRRGWVRKQVSGYPKALLSQLSYLSHFGDSLCRESASLCLVQKSLVTY